MRAYNLALIVPVLSYAGAQSINGTRPLQNGNLILTPAVIQTVSVFATCGVPTRTAFPQGFSGISIASSASVLLPSFTFSPLPSSSCTLSTASSLPTTAAVVPGDENFPPCNTTNALDACTSVQGQTCRDANGLAYTFSCAQDPSCGVVIPDNSSLTKRSFLASFAECLASCDAQTGCVAASYDTTNTLADRRAECRLFAAVIQVQRISRPIQLAIRWFAAIGGPIPFPPRSSSRSSQATTPASSTVLNPSLSVSASNIAVSRSLSSAISGSSVLVSSASQSQGLTASSAQISSPTASSGLSSRQSSGTAVLPSASLSQSQSSGSLATSPVASSSVASIASSRSQASIISSSGSAAASSAGVISSASPSGSSGIVVPPSRSQSQSSAASGQSVGSPSVFFPSFTFSVRSTGTDPGLPSITSSGASSGIAASRSSSQSLAAPSSNASASSGVVPSLPASQSSLPSSGIASSSPSSQSFPPSSGLASSSATVSQASSGAQLPTSTASASASLASNSSTASQSISGFIPSQSVASSIPTISQRLPPVPRIKKKRVSNGRKA